MRKKAVDLMSKQKFNFFYVILGAVALIVTVCFAFVIDSVGKPDLIIEESNLAELRLKHKGDLDLALKRLQYALKHQYKYYKFLSACPRDLDECSAEAFALGFDSSLVDFVWPAFDLLLKDGKRVWSSQDNVMAVLDNFTAVREVYKQKFNDNTNTPAAKAAMTLFTCYLLQSLWSDFNDAIDQGGIK